MEMVDLLRRCTRLEEGAAQIYDTFARRFRADDVFSRFWTGMAEDERRHAKKLATWRRLLRLSRKAKGSEIAGFDEGVRDLERLLRDLRRKAGETATAEQAFSIAIALEQSELDPIYTALLQSSPLARFPDLADTQQAEMGEHHRALLAMIRTRSTDEENLMGAALLDASHA
jgi:rubrerythrin